MLPGLLHRHDFCVRIACQCFRCRLVDGKGEGSWTPGRLRQRAEVGLEDIVANRKAVWNGIEACEGTWDGAHGGCSEGHLGSYQAWEEQEITVTAGPEPAG